jgi:drug/metabolite transporter (DMT)-like permease
MQSLWMLCATFLFAIMSACVKLASSYYTTSEILLCRGLFGVAFVLVLIRMNGGTLATKYITKHLTRSVIGVISLWMTLIAVTLLPLATATTLNYMSPIWIAIILFFIDFKQGKERVDVRLSATIVLSFIGVALLLRPSLHAEQLTGGIIGLISGVLTALAYLQVRGLSQLGEPEYRVVFYFSLTGAITGLVACFAQGIIPFFHHNDPIGVALILTIGITATLAQMTLTRAYRLGNTLLTANLQYSGILFSSALSVLIWSNTMDWMGWSGIAIILISGLLSTYYHHRRMQAAKRQAQMNAAS